MAKRKRTSRKVQEPVITVHPKSSVIELLEKPTYILGFFIVLFIILVVLYKPLVLQGEEPAGSDIISGIGKTHQMSLWEQKTGHYPLWNPAMFAGMPSYHRFGPKVWSIDTLLNKMDFLIDWRIWYFLAGAFGIFLVVKFFGLPAVAGMMAALGFVLMPHFQALIIVGHFSKFRALMWTPYVLLSALLLLKRKDILAALVFSLALALQFRTQHYQIMFYTLLAVVFIGIPPFFRLLKEKQWLPAGKIAAFSVAAALAAILMVSQNLMSIKEYTPYSTRGGNAISINKPAEQQQEKKGVGFDYATNWSYSVSEWWNLIVPRFHGGTSNERYTGNAVPAWQNRVLPTYWGSMPFTQSYEYLGILLVFLAFVAVLFEWQRWEVKSLTFLTLFALLMSLGKNFAVLYRLFFYYVPYFDKFRVPMMILTLIMFCVSLLAAFGLSGLIKLDYSKKELTNKLYILGGVFVVILALPLLFGSSFSLSHSGEVQRYGAEILSNLKKVRLDLLKGSALTALFLLLLTSGSIFAVQKKWFSKEFLPFIIIVLTAIDFLVLDSHYVQGKFINKTAAEKQHYQQTSLIQTIQSDPSLYRVFPVGGLFQDTRWSYFFQSIGGYSPAKMQTIQEIVDNNLHANRGKAIPINWKIVDMLNVKYLVANQKLNSTLLKLRAEDSSQKLFAYEYLNALPRAFFVKNYKIIKNGVERLRYLNSAQFSPAWTAVLEEAPTEEVKIPDSSRTKVDYHPEKITVQAYTNQPALMVLSEMYYPPGWTATLDGKRDLHIFKTDHMLRSVIVPPGEHSIEFNFHPKSYYAGLRISSISLLVVYGLLIFFLYRNLGHLLHRRTKK